MEEPGFMAVIPKLSSRHHNGNIFLCRDQEDRKMHITEAKMTVFFESSGVTCHEYAPQGQNNNQHFNLYVPVTQRALNCRKGGNPESEIFTTTVGLTYFTRATASLLIRCDFLRPFFSVT
jgi:hypothetical protein